MNSPTRRWTWAVFGLVSLVVVLVAGALSACGDDDDDKGTPAASGGTAAATSTSTVRFGTGTTTQAAAASTVSVLSGAVAGEKAAGSIKVGAASDLRTVMTEIQPVIEQKCATRINFVFGSSGQLSTQIQAGADFGLLLSADSQYPADLVKAGLIVPNGTASYGVGRIVLATRKGIAPVGRLDQLGRADIKKVAIANPDHAPYGRAAKQALEKAGVYTVVQSKLVLGENIRQTADYVEKGDADAAIIALALVINGSPASYTLIDATLHNPIEQSGAVIRGTGAELTGRCILQYILDPAGQEALARYGFEKVKR